MEMRDDWSVVVPPAGFLRNQLHGFLKAPVSYETSYRAF
jgi:hypothetical protein